MKKVQKNFKNNYASVECGAKILSANNEAKVRHTPPLSPAAYIQTQMFSFRWKKPASFHLGYVFKPNEIKNLDADPLIILSFLQSTSAILMENMDLYMLNPCSNKIWWVHWRTLIQVCL